MNTVARNEIQTSVRRLSRIFVVILAPLLGGSLQLHGISVESRSPAVTIRNISVTASDHDLDVEIEATSPITPVTQVVGNPDRLIVDFQQALPGAGLHKVLVHRGNLIDVRVGLLSANPRVTRVVLDLASPTQFRVDSSGSTIVVKLNGESSPAATVQPAAVITKSPAETETANTTALNPEAVHGRTPERSRAHWILPILTVASVLAMLVIALVSHIQNKQGGHNV